ncbi:2-methylcitrate synthase [Oligella ureolytica]|uniref:citryl-CoA lyase n=1 Tax=Oligella ureolytica TaxID=90244 RepID=UPI000E028D76|nr:citryl-CoA lyase [Oligella ureolytica]SUA59117.1 2-methylcitrate synthase [Oligella ureolytica]
MNKLESSVQADMQNWWSTNIIDMEPGTIRYHGYAIQDLIGKVDYADIAWLMLRGEMPTKEQSKLLNAALVAGVDHGPQAPSIAIARMASTCGVSLNNAMASGINVLGDVHGGAGEQAVEFYQKINLLIQKGESIEKACELELEEFWKSGKKFIPGFGHRFHPVDPRAPRLLSLVDEAQKRGVVDGRFSLIAKSLETVLEEIKGKKIPMNIDGATAVIYAELGFAAPLARGLFCLSRSIGILAHAWEQMQEPTRNKGPIPREFIWSYTGHPPRELKEDV